MNVGYQIKIVSWKCFIFHEMSLKLISWNAHKEKCHSVSFPLGEFKSDQKYFDK